MSTVTELRHPSSMSARPRVLFPWSTNACPRPISTTASRLATPRFPRRQSQDAPQHPNLQKAVKDERRRRMYLEKVQQKAEDKKWGARSEQILREDFLASQRQWLESQGRSAPPTLDDPGDDDMEGISTEVGRQAEEMIDEILSKENEEVEALVSMLEERPHEVSPDLDETSTYSSDEESYEAVFAEVLRAFPEEDTSTCNARQAGGGSGEQGKDYEAMDTTG